MFGYLDPMGKFCTGCCKSEVATLLLFEVGCQGGHAASGKNYDSYYTQRVQVPKDNGISSKKRL